MDALNQRFRNFRACCDDAPAGTYTQERELREVIGNAVDQLMAEGRRLGLKPCNCDGAHNVEATIYAWLTEGTLFGIAAESYGEHGGRLPV